MYKYTAKISRNGAFFKLDILLSFSIHEMSKKDIKTSKEGFLITNTLLNSKKHSIFSNFLKSQTDRSQNWSKSRFSQNGQKISYFFLYLTFFELFSDFWSHIPPLSFFTAKYMGNIGPKKGFRLNHNFSEYWRKSIDFGDKICTNFPDPI